MKHTARPILLYLENEKRVNKDVTSRMVAQGFDVISLHYPHEPAEYLDDHQCPDAFLFDLALGGDRDGFEIALELCEHYVIAHAKFFFLTAWPDKFSIPSEFSSDNVFGKPASTRQMARAIHDAIRKESEQA